MEEINEERNHPKIFLLLAGIVLVFLLLMILKILTIAEVFISLPLVLIVMIGWWELAKGRTE